MKTLPVMIRVEPKKWHVLQREASKLDLTTPQLIRRILDDYLKDTKSHARSLDIDHD
jgi:hypothetical protein